MYTEMQRKTDTTGYELQQGQHHEKYNTQTTKTLQKKRNDSFTPHQHCTRNSDTPHTQTPKKWITIQNTTRIHKKNKSKHPTPQNTKDEKSRHDRSSQGRSAKTCNCNIEAVSEATRFPLSATGIRASKAIARIKVPFSVLFHIFFFLILG